MLTAALIFVMCGGFVLYEIMARATDQINGLVSRTEPCRLVAGPRHAKLRDTGNGWESESVVWIGLFTAANSQVSIRLTQPPGTALTWKFLDVMGNVWRLVGTDAQGRTSYELTINRTSELESLGQFQLVALPETKSIQGLAIEITAAGSSPSGSAITDTIQVHLLPDNMTTEMRPL